MANAYPPLIAALCEPACYPHPVKRVTVLETHISWVLLAGRYAYKIKKPVNLGFLDFSQLSQRHFYCQEEIRLNRRLAPGIYLQVAAIGSSPVHPIVSAEPAFEYAVKMRRFATDKLLDTLLTRGGLTPDHIDSLAETIAKFHTGLLPANPESDYGTLTAIDAPARQNFRQLLELMSPEDAALINQLQDDSRQTFLAAENLFKQRQQAGFIRECHGDLHLGNIVLLRGRPVAFDGIEFSPALRWIDTINDAAFLIMDLVHRGRVDLAYRFLNAYLQISGDFAGLGVLRFYLSYRAAVRAKIAGFRFAQTGAESARQECLSYLSLAGSSLSPRKPALILTHGLPGCGKSAVSQILLEKHLLIRLRSDVERKRLFGLSALQKSGSTIDSDIYDPQASQKTYLCLLNMAQTLLEYGFALIIDAAFLKHTQRRPFQLLAQNLQIPFVILSITATEDVLRRRILHRQAEDRDASEADLTVLDKAMTKAEELQAEELPHNLVLANDNDGLDKNDRQAAWRELARVLE